MMAKETFSFGIVYQPKSSFALDKNIIKDIDT